MGEGALRVSVATLCRVTFDHPAEHRLWLALERRATFRPEPPPHTIVVAVPYGGAVRILRPEALAAVVPDFRYDSERSKTEQDFRIVIPPTTWPAVREFCLAHIAAPDDNILDNSPDRELKEEFVETLGVEVAPGDYAASAVGTVVEDGAAPTNSDRAPGAPTVRIYRLFEVRLLAPSLVEAIMASTLLDEATLAARAEAQSALGGRGRANAAVGLPLAAVREALRLLPPQARALTFTVGEQRMDGTVSALFPDLAGPARRWLAA